MNGSVVQRESVSPVSLNEALVYAIATIDGVQSYLTAKGIELGDESRYSSESAALTEVRVILVAALLLPNLAYSLPVVLSQYFLPLNRLFFERQYGISVTDATAEVVLAYFIEQKLVETMIALTELQGQLLLSNDASAYAYLYALNTALTQLPDGIRQIPQRE